MRGKLILTASLWAALVSLSFGWNYANASQERRNLAFETARAFFQQVVLSRLWNAQHGGIYVPVTQQTEPNPYLEAPNRDIVVSESLTLTKINPAYMTRQLAEIATDADGIRFHITSLKPIRPGNAPDAWEAESLRRFEKGAGEYGEFMRGEGRELFRYMAPLITGKACLQCHEQQGYREGDVRGGISVTLPRVAEVPIASLAGGHLLIGLTGLVFILGMGRLLEQSYSQLRHQAVFDALTRIPNRRFFIEQLVREFRRGRREKRPLSLIICDIDNFKRYNDVFGHQAGDRCLQAVALALDGGLRRGGDSCARYGGEEFVVVLPNTAGHGALVIAESLRQAVEGLGIEHPGTGAGVVTISMGVATDNADSLDHEVLIQHADEALYRAKAGGRNRVEVYGDE